MTSDEFDQLVNRIQARYGSRPAALRWRIALMVGLGYAGFLAVLLVVLVLCAGLAVGAFAAGREPGIILMALVAVLLAAGICQTMVLLWVPMTSDPARDVTRDEVPQLFQLLDTLQSELGVSPFHHVRITSEFNAAVLMIPRLGVFGFNRTYLYLGLPLVRVLTVRQFAAVLAHEFAHCSSRHDRFGMWIYRLRLTWARVFAELHDANSKSAVKSVRGIIVWFIDWYWPRFNAYAFVLSRANEYEADRLAAERAGVDSAAEALYRIECIGTRLSDKFWSEVTKQARTDETVPDDILGRMQTYLCEAPDPADAARWLTQSAQTLTGNVDTHPSLSDRLKSLGQRVDRFQSEGFPFPPSDNAADALLGDALPQIEREVNHQWQKENSLRWQNVFHQARRLEKQLESTSASLGPAESNERDSSISLGVPMPSMQQSDREVVAQFDVDQLWQQVRTICELQGTAAAEPLLRQLLVHRPSHAPANVTLGRNLLERGQSEGEQFLRRVLDDDDNDLIPAACQGLILYFQQMGQSERVSEARLQLSRYEASQVAAARERSTVTAADTFLPHDLSDSEFAELATTLSHQPQLSSAWLVRKQLQHFKRQRMFVMVAQSQPTGLFGGSNPDVDRALVSSLITTAKLPGRLLVVGPQGGFKRLATKIISCPGSQIVQGGRTLRKRSS